MISGPAGADHVRCLDRLLGKWQAAEVDDVKICKVDVDQCMDLARQYKVVSIPMLVVFENGEVTGKQLGLISKEEVLHLIGK